MMLLMQVAADADETAYSACNTMDLQVSGFVLGWCVQALQLAV
jgi:hypothetical protein